MSAGGQNSSTLSGIQGMRIRDASDVDAQNRVREIFQLFNSSTPNAVRPRIPNGNDVYLQFLQGIKESSSNVSGGSASCTACAGLTYNGNRLILTYRNGNFPPV
jgi:hypothetical protein